MRYLSLFSGIEAATSAWHPLGWECVGVAEIEPFPSKVLRHHYPNVRNLGDVTKLTEMDIADLGPIDVVVFGSPCFTAGHTVLTARGLVPIETVVVGDMVWTHASRWKRVSNVMTRTAPTVVVNGQGHNAIRATPDHPFYAAETIKTWNGNGYTRSIGSPEWVHAESMADKRWATPVNLTCEVEVPAGLRSLDAAYLAGLYVGDGHIGRTTGRNKKSVILSVGFAKRDKMLPKLQAAWGTVSCFEHTQSVVRLQVSRTHLADAMLENFGELSHAKSIPVWALCASAEWQTAFLQGILDTDGSVKTNRYRVTTVSRPLAVSLRLLCARLGYSTSLSFSERPKTCVIEGRTVNQRDTWTVALRKGNRTSEVRTGEHAWGLVRSVSPAADAQVFDITVEDDHSFICDGIVVHNCQDLSVAGKRKGLAGARSGLFFTAMQIITWSRLWCGTRFALWENVPGAFSSNKGADFAAVVDELSGLAGTEPPPKGWGTEGCTAGPEAMVEWSTLDAQWFGVAQRRRRVFALADFGNWAGRQPILLEPQSMRGDSAPSRASGQVAPTIPARSLGGGGLGTDFDCDGGVIQAFGGNNTPGPIDVATARSACASASGRLDFESETFLVQATAHTLRGEGFDASEDGTGRGTPLVPVSFANTAPTLKRDYGKGYGADATTELATTLRAMGHTDSHANGGGQMAVLAFHSNAQPDQVQFDPNTSAAVTCSQYPAVAIALRGREGGGTAEMGDEVGNCLRASSGGGDKPHVLAYTTKLHNTASNQAGKLHEEYTTSKVNRSSPPPALLTATQVRRLTPRECERLQGFPDDYTLLPGKAPDGPRYKALGNSMAVPVMRWIGRQINTALLFQE